jgi:hypothetical protein
MRQLQLSNVDAAALDQALDRLREPMAVQNRLDVLKELVNFRHGPIRPEDGINNVDKVGGVPLPLPLRFWYGWAGKRTDIMRGQNILYLSDRSSLANSAPVRMKSRRRTS